MESFHEEQNVVDVLELLVAGDIFPARETALTAALKCHPYPALAELQWLGQLYSLWLPGGLFTLQI